ncbi:MAG: carboxymuconolactone decarboxylase family protein [Ignavibacteriaceae bacterium]
MNSLLQQIRYTITIFIVALVISTPLLAQENATEGWNKAQVKMKAMMGSVPVMFEKMPMQVRVNAWELFKSINNPKTAIPSKYGELIGLAVAAQIPCEYCIIAHTTLAKLFGATDEEVEEALTKGAETRFLSTVLNGSLVDIESFKSDWNKTIEFMKAHSK